MTERVISARHRAEVRATTPFDPFIDSLSGVGRRTVAVVASSGLVAAGATIAMANENETARSAAADVAAIIGSASYSSVPADAMWSLDVPEIVVTVPVKKAPARAHTTAPAEAVAVAPQVKAVVKTESAEKDKTTTAVKEGVFARLTVAEVASPKRDISRADNVEDAIGSAVLEVAARYVGVPYRYGGSSPRGFDCSGFTQYVYGQLGIKLPHNSEGQPGKGRVVSREDARPGDLVYTPGHVAIYAGGNKMIDSAHTGTTVSFHKMWQRNPTFIRLVD